MARIARIILLVVFMCSPAYAKTLRVISLYPGHSENIYALGGSDMLAAISENDDVNFLPSLPRIPLRSGAERILALRPDIVITRSLAIQLDPNVYDVLERSGVKVLILDPPAWNDFPEYLETLAQYLGLDSSSALHRLKTIREDIKSRAEGRGESPRVFLEAASREIHTCSPESWAARLIELAGGRNIASEAKPLREGSAIASWGIEKVLENKPDVYIIQTGAMNSSGIEDFHAREWSRALEGVRVAEVPERYMSRPSLLGLEHGIRELEKIFWEE